MPGINWAMNMGGITISEQRMANIPYPRFELHVHVATKTVQAGSLLGTCMVGPILAAVKGPRDVQGLKQWAETAGKYGILVGLIAGPLMTEAKLQAAKASKAAIWDRSYRIRFNRTQVRCDQLTLVGAAAGYFAASYLGDSQLLGALVGMNSGLIFATVINACL